MSQLEKSNAPKHNKVFDPQKGKFVDVSEAGSVKSKVKVCDQELFVKNGNALGRAEAEIDLLLYEAENKTYKTNSTERESLNQLLTRD